MVINTVNTVLFGQVPSKPKQRTSLRSIIVTSLVLLRKFNTKTDGSGFLKSESGSVKKPDPSGSGTLIETYSTLLWALRC